MRAPTPISTLGQRIRLIENAGVDVLVIQEFDKAFSSLSPDAFISTYLVNGLKARLLCVGHNFRFGNQHKGNIDTLRGWTPGFEVIEVPQVSLGGHMVSSSRVRQCLTGGDVSLARRFLGQCYEIEGDVVSGTGRGSRETVPTLNMRPNNELLPKNGVYCTRVRLAGSDSTECPWANALTNIGTRPTFGGENVTVETYVLDKAIPPQPGEIALRFLRRLRDEQRFENADALKVQIDQDAVLARRFFQRLDASSDDDGVAVCSPGDSHEG
jgi:riboflavin kinase/FMN adenylyltransferase